MRFPYWYDVRYRYTDNILIICILILISLLINPVRFLLT